MKLIQKFNKDMTMFVHYVVRFILEKEFRKKMSWVSNYYIGSLLQKKLHFTLIFKDFKNSL